MIDCMYIGMVEGCVWVVRVGGWAAGDRLYLQIGLFGVAASPRSASHRPRQT